MAAFKRDSSLTNSFRRSFFLNDSAKSSPTLKRSTSLNIKKPAHLNSFHTKLDYMLFSGNGVSDMNTDRTSESKNTNLFQIRRSHWKDSSKVQSCEKCMKSLGFGNKKLNCHRCGNVFCDSCCQYRKRLSPEGVPDPQGNVYRVCYSCADLHTQPMGKIQSLTELFREQRNNKRLNLAEELRRLIEGFEENVDPNSPFKSVVHDLSLKVPEWQKSEKWMESADVDWCMKCSSKFNLFNLKRHCRLCGSVYCMKCVNSNLLLYYDENGKACGKLIGVVGCPDKEPPISIYLKICLLCEEDFEEYQVQQYYNHESKSNHLLKDNVKGLESTLEQLKVIEKKLDDSLPRFYEQLETYLFEGNPKINIDGENNVELFAKAYVDIGDLLTRSATIIYGLKQLEATSKIEGTIIQNVICVKYKQYSTGMNLFKSLKYTVDKSFPPKALLMFQNYANMQAINYTCVMTRQLGLEALKLSMQYGFDTSLAEKLREADSICYSELEGYLESASEDKSEHLRILNDLLKLQLKERKLVVFDSDLAAKEGSSYVHHFLIQRCSSLVYQILKSLKAKSSETQFSNSKEHLQQLLRDVMDIQTKSET